MTMTSIPISEWFRGFSWWYVVGWLIAFVLIG